MDIAKLKDSLIEDYITNWKERKIIKEIKYIGNVNFKFVKFKSFYIIFYEKVRFFVKKTLYFN